MTPEEYYAAHQRSFRCAFDFLNAHFPPGDSPEWWEQAANDMKSAAEKQGDYRLAVLLLVGVWDYIHEEQQRRIQNDTIKD